jgi:hypothetical protein
LTQLKMPRSTVMIFRRDCVSESAQEFIKIMRTMYAVPAFSPLAGSYQAVRSGTNKLDRRPASPAKLA